MAKRELTRRQQIALQEWRILDLVKKDFRVFCQVAWERSNPNMPLTWNWHLDYLCECLEALSEGRFHNLLINIAPRSFKSTLVSIYYPCWEWLREPHNRFLCLSYSAALAIEHSQIRRSLIRQDWYQAAAEGKCLLKSDKNRLDEYENVSGGAMISRGLDGSVLGSGGNRILIDDPNSPEDAYSQAERESRSRKFREYVTTRKNSPDTRLLLIQQRIAEGDCSGIVLDELDTPDTPWFKAIVPTRAPDDIDVEYPISGKVYHRRKGSLMHPERHSEVEDAAARLALGSFGYSARHDQRPAPSSGGVFEAGWFKQFDPEQVEATLFDRGEFVLSLDTSFGSEAEQASYNVLGLYGVAYPNFYVLDLWRKKCSYVELKRAISVFIGSWVERLGFAPHKFLIEVKATGQPLISELKQTYQYIIPVNPKASKEARTQAISPTVEAGRLWVPNSANWRHSFIHEFITYPKGENDDQIDATSQLIAHYMRVWARRQSQYGTRMTHF